MRYSDEHRSQEASSLPWWGLLTRWAGGETAHTRAHPPPSQNVSGGVEHCKGDEAGGDSTGRVGVVWSGRRGSSSSGG